MKFLKNIESGKVTLLVTAIMVVVYLYAAFGNDNPLMSVLALFKTSLLMKFFISFVALHFSLKGLCRALNNIKSYFASVGLFISIGIIIGGGAMSMNIRETETKKVMISEKVGSLTIQDIKMTLPEGVLVIGESSDLNLGDIEVFAFEKGRNVVIGPFPFARTSEGYAYINNAGLSPTMQIDVNGNMYKLDKMQLLPPGKEFVVHMGNDVEAVISMKHARSFMKGRLSAREYDLSMPGYNVLIKKDNKAIFDETIDSEGQKTEGNIKVEVGRTNSWAEIVFVKDFMVYVIYAGIVSFVLFMLCYPLEFYGLFFKR